jgi:hypothetical protein
MPLDAVDDCLVIFFGVFGPSVTLVFLPRPVLPVAARFAFWIFRLVPEVSSVVLPSAPGTDSLSAMPLLPTGHPTGGSSTDD